jgi:hypothetical protein
VRESLAMQCGYEEAGAAKAIGYTTTWSMLQLVAGADRTAGMLQLAQSTFGAPQRGWDGGQPLRCSMVSCS